MRKGGVFVIILVVAYFAYRAGYLPVSFQSSEGPTAKSSNPIQQGVAPISAWDCPLTHPIKGNFTTYSGERCIYHVRGGQFYNRTKPEKCYANAADARAEGCRASKR